MENEIKVGDWIRTVEGQIHYIDKLCGHYENGNLIYDKQIVCWDGKIAGFTISELQDIIVKHSPNLKDIIQNDDFVNKCRVYEVEEKGITVYQTVENSATDYNWISFDEIQEIVTKEMMESISYKVTKM